MFTADFLGHVVNAFDSCPWGTASGRCCQGGGHGGGHTGRAAGQPRNRPLYTPEERRRRDASPWTIVQGVLAPVQFLVFLISLGLVLNYLITGDGLSLATFSIIVKTLTLYTIMVTGSIWEHEVYGRYLFAPAFYWEDMVSMLVLALHTAYIAALLTGALAPHDLMLLALAAYVTYVVNATQFVFKLRAARLASAAWPQGDVVAAMGAAR